MSDRDEPGEEGRVPDQEKPFVVVRSLPLISSGKLSKAVKQESNVIKFIF